MWQWTTSAEHPERRSRIHIQVSPPGMPCRFSHLSSPSRSLANREPSSSSPALVPTQWMVAWAFNGVPTSRAKARAAIMVSACRKVMRFVGRRARIYHCGLARHHRGYLPVTPGTLASGRACIGRLSSSFLAPQTLQTRWFATSGTGMRLGNPSDSGSI